MTLQCPLEQTIVDRVEQCLREMRGALPDVLENPFDFESPWRDAKGLIELAHIQDSGLSDVAVQRLLTAESDTNALYRQVNSASAPGIHPKLD